VDKDKVIRCRGYYITFCKIYIIHTLARCSVFNYAKAKNCGEAQFLLCFQRESAGEVVFTNVSSSLTTCYPARVKNPQSKIPVSYTRILTGAREGCLTTGKIFRLQAAQLVDFRIA